MKVVSQSPEELEILIELPRFIIWFMLGPIAAFGGLFALALLLGGEFLNGLVTGAFVAIGVTVGRYFLTQRTQLWLHAPEGKVRILRSTLLDSKDYEFPLEHLESAEVHHNRHVRSSSEGTSRATSNLNLVFANTRPATRVPLSGWSISGPGAGMLADAINDWLRDLRNSNSNSNRRMEE
jgi:hypothetical protein